MFKFLIRFLKILAILCIIGVSLKVIDIVFHKENYKEKHEDISEIAMENVLNRLSEEEVLENVDTEKTEQEADTIVQEQVKKEEVKTSKEQDKKVVESKAQEKVVKEAPKAEEKKTEVKVEEKQEKVVEQKKEEIIVEQKKEENKPTEEKVITEQKVIKEEYKENSQMINKIKDIINNNLSEDMKEYGYNIVVDSSIPELTNEFTFTEQRVITKLKYKSGTIRVYARDYYYNGKYVSTQCFII